MRRPASIFVKTTVLVKTTVTIASVALVASCAACEARVYGAPGDHAPAGPQLTIVAPRLLRTPPRTTPQAAPSFTGLQEQADQAVAAAADQGADIGVLVLDRETGERIAAGKTTGWATASVVKLFIADDLLLREPNLSPRIASPWMSCCARPMTVRPRSSGTAAAVARS